MLVYHLAIICSTLLDSTNGFSIPNTAAATACRVNNNASLLRSHHTLTPRASIITLLHLSSNDNDNEEDSSSTQNKKTKGDSIRSKTGIRPSLHPTEINCIAEALMLRSSSSQEVDIDIATSTEPLQVAITAGSIAMNAIDKRNSDKDDTSEKFTMEESQTISGRVVGVVMRMRELEELLVQKVKGVGWVKRYGEEESFGVLKSECNEDGTNNNKEELDKKVGETIKLNPLFRMNRAECLLCLFLDTVEKPKLQLLGEDVAGGSEVDFIDADRLEVLRTVIE